MTTGVATTTGRAVPTMVHELVEPVTMVQEVPTPDRPGPIPAGATTNQGLKDACRKGPAGLAPVTVVQAPDQEVADLVNKPILLTRLNLTLCY